MGLCWTLANSMVKISSWRTSLSIHWPSDNRPFWTVKILISYPSKCHRMSHGQSHSRDCSYWQMSLFMACATVRNDIPALCESINEGEITVTLNAYIEHITVCNRLQRCRHHIPPTMAQFTSMSWLEHRFSFMTLIGSVHFLRVS